MAQHQAAQISGGNSVCIRIAGKRSAAIEWSWALGSVPKPCGPGADRDCVRNGKNESAAKRAAGALLSLRWQALRMYHTRLAVGLLTLGRASGTCIRIIITRVMSPYILATILGDRRDRGLVAAPPSFYLLSPRRTASWFHRLGDHERRRDEGGGLGAGGGERRPAGWRRPRCARV